MNVTSYVNLIKEKFGLSISPNEYDSLSVAIKLRMKCLKIFSSWTYLERLKNDPAEVSFLANLLTNNETYFFREKSHFDLTREILIPKIQARKKGKIKMISAGCATGEEPYTLAISLLEKFGDFFLEDVSIIAFDIDPNVISKAKKAIFNKHSFRGVSPEVSKIYFDPLPNRNFKLRDFVKNRVEFHHCNLLNKKFPSAFADPDIIFYRNVSIYFETDTQKKVFENLASLLVDGGYLLVGSAETYSHDRGILDLVEDQGIFYFEKKLHKTLTPRSRMLLEIKEISSVIHTNFVNKVPKKRGFKALGNKEKIIPKGRNIRKNHASTPSRLFEKAVTAAKKKNYRDALDLIDHLILENPRFNQAQSLKANILVNLRRLAEAKALCIAILNDDEWNLECFLLLGEIAKLNEDSGEAIKRFKQAIYVQPSFWLAHYYLGEIYVSQKNHSVAKREFEVAIHLLATKGVRHSGFSLFPFSFSKDQLIHLCQHKIETIRTSTNKKTLEEKSGV